VNTSIFKLFIGSSSIQVLNQILLVLLSIFFARVLGPEQFGLYNLILSIIAVSVVPVIAGMQQLLIREISKLTEAKEFNYIKGIIYWSAYYLVVMSCFTIITLYLSGKFGFFSETVNEILILGYLFIPIKGLLIQQSAILNGFRLPILSQLPSTLIVQFISLLLFVVIFNIEENLSAKVLIILQFTASCLALIIGYVFVSKCLPIKLREYSHKYSIKKWQKSLIPFTAITFVSTFNSETATLILGFYVDNESVGFYKIALQGSLVLALGLQAVNVIIAPDIARLFAKGHISSMQEVISKSVKISVLFALPITFTLLIFGSEIIILLFGKEYESASSLLTVLVIGQFFNACFGSVGLIMNMTGNERKALNILFVSMSLSIFLMSILIPDFGALGAAYSTAITLIFWNVWMSYRVYTETGIKTWIRIFN